MDAWTASLIVERSPDALLVLDADGSVQSWNPAAERLLGLPAAQALGRPLAQLIGDAVSTLIAAGQDLSQRPLTAHRADGALLYARLSLAVQRDPAGRVVGHVCTLVDVTAARVAQDGEAVQVRYRGLFESLPDAIVIVNDSGRIVHVNAQAVQLFGHAAELIVGEPVEVLLPQRLRTQHLPQRSAYLREPGLRPMGRGLPLHGLHAKGHEFPVEISLSPIDLDGRRLVISAIRDIGDRVAIEQALQQKNLELERANRAKDHFLATMSHELRTPLNAILGFTGLMLMKLPGPLTETQERHLQHVQSSGKHLLSLINDLLDLAKIESGHVELVCEPVDARPVIDEVLTALRPAAFGKQLVLEAELPAGPLWLQADRRALHQVVLNLTGNAIKFTESGRVCVRASVQQVDGQAHWTLAVVDTGVGISPEDQARLFQAFVQVGDRLRRRGEGTGLGLHLSRKLVDLMGGTLQVRSVPGQGSCFTLSLPAAA